VTDELSAFGGELRATAQHLALVQRKLTKLEQAKEDGWDQMLTALARLVRACRPTPQEADLLPMLNQMRDSYGSGYARLWDRHLAPRFPARGIRSTVAAHEQIRRRMERNLPNGPTPGTWVGEVPSTWVDPQPQEYQAVVYILFDALNAPVYVGSTDNFPVRLKTHVRQKPGIARWTAYLCEDREAAYRLEDKVLKERMPNLNKRRGR
jgi:predicted GIY-YIG superfamily endonuclease